MTTQLNGLRRGWSLTCFTAAECCLSTSSDNPLDGFEISNPGLNLKGTTEKTTDNIHMREKKRIKSPLSWIVRYNRYSCLYHTYTIPDWS